MRLLPALELLGLAFGLDITALAQVAPPAAATKAPGLKMGQILTDPKRHGLVPCLSSPDCWKDVTLGSAIFTALTTLEKHPRGGVMSITPERRKIWALAWRLYRSTAPAELTEPERVLVRAALFKNMISAIAYAACLKIVAPEECAPK